MQVTHQHAAVQADGSLQEELLAWIKTQIQLGHVEFETKGDDNGDRQFN